MDGSIEIDTGSDYSILDDEWAFILKATSKISTAFPNNVVEYFFRVSLLDGCLLDTLNPLSTIESFAYYIDYTALI